MITAVVAVRVGSQRVKDKNIKPFAGSNLLELKLSLLKQVRNIDEIVVDSDSDEMLDIGIAHGVSVQKRIDYYASSECTNSEFHGHIAETTETDIIFLAPVCAPFVSIESHENSIDYYLQNDFDSVVSVTEVRNHLWLDGKPLNYDLNNVPNSQDLPDVLKLNYGITIVDREVMKNEKRVVCHSPGFYKLNEIESIDIDTELDFMIAEIIYEKYYKE